MVYSRRVTTSHGEPQGEHNLNLGPKRESRAHSALGKSDGASNIIDGSINYPTLQKEIMSPQ